MPNTYHARPLLALVTVLLTTSVSSKAFTSLAKMKTLPALERSLITALADYLLSAEPSSHTNVLRRFLRKSNAECLMAESDAQFLENPVNCFHVLRRLVDGWNDVIEVINLDCSSETASTVFGDIAEETTSAPVWPERADLGGSMVAMARLIYMYDLDLGNVSRGVLRDTRTVPLSARDLVMFGDECNEADLHYDAVQFYKQALEVLTSSHYDESDDNWSRLMDELMERKHTAVTPYLLYRKIISTYYHFGAPSLALKTLDRALLRLSAASPDQIERLETDRDYYAALQREYTTTEPVFERKFAQLPDVKWESYVDLCRNPPKRRSSPNLYCKYWKTINPLYRVKAEYANRNPDVVRFYDVIYESEMHFLKETSFDKLQRSAVISDTHKVIKERISESAWHHDTQIAQLRKLNHRIHVITGLDVSVTDIDTPSEELQILNYGLGGMYEPHYDAYYHYSNGARADVRFLNSGDRIATMVFYLSDVTYGGATVFPKLQLKIEPEKGSASFWWNLHRDGSIDRRSLHAGCPVLVGEKWLVNKWIRQFAQMWTRPCGLNSDS